MKNLLTLLIICLTFQTQTQAQQFYNQLYGFKLGQYREAAKNEFGIPFQSGKYDDGFEYEAFLLKPDSSLYIVFEYAAGKTDIIWSIQVSGTNSVTDVGINSARFGIDKSKTEKLFGKPSSTEDIGEYGHKWIYDNTNISLEIDANGKLSSIKILDNSNVLFPGAPDVSKIPAFEKIQKTLNSDNNVDIFNLLSGDVEIYINDSTYYFKKSFVTEASTDYSGMVSIIKKISKDLATVDTRKEEGYEENLRMTLGEDPKHVIKIKKGHSIKEIVLKYYGGQYVIYEINASN